MEELYEPNEILVTWTTQSQIARDTISSRWTLSYHDASQGSPALLKNWSSFSLFS